jgi:hypothetical protein
LESRGFPQKFQLPNETLTCYLNLFADRNVADTDHV